MPAASTFPAPIPTGVADYFWHEALNRRTLEADLLALFRSWGYNDVLPPAFEYADTIHARADHELQQELYRFVDRDGSTLALRADMTIPVARLVATRLHDLPMPQRFCYAGSIFRYAETRGGRQREFWQAGVELIGAGEAAADAELLALTARALERAGLADIKLAVGHLGYFHALRNELALPDAAESLLLNAIDRNSDAALADFLQTTALSDAHRGVLARLPHLSGEETEAILTLAHALALNAEMHAALDNLAAILRELAAHNLSSHIYLDLTEIHNLGYYTGITFEALSPGMGFAIASGGRYDSLIGSFGAAQPAVGVALLIDRILLARTPADGEPRPVPPHVLVQPSGDPDCLALVESWRRDGLRVAIDLSGRGGEGLWQQARAMGAPVAVTWVDGALDMHTVIAHLQNIAPEHASGWLLDRLRLEPAE
jgi:ATP phosphoribosyltransferase regulatory subunit